MKTIAPIYTGRRHYPTAHAIEAALRANPAVLNLRTRRLQRDVMDRFGVSPCTARTAIGFARRGEGRHG